MLNVREDHLQRFAKDTEFDAVLPALGNKGVRFKVFYSAALPDFATWRATRAGQGFDARTFEVKARPAAPIAGARPGMSVLVQQASRQEKWDLFRPPPAVRAARPPGCATAPGTWP